MKKHISETEYCMWEVEFRLYKSYKKEIFSFKEAENDFNAKIRRFHGLNMMKK